MVPCVRDIMLNSYITCTYSAYDFLHHALPSDPASAGSFSGYDKEKKCSIIMAPYLLL